MKMVAVQPYAQTKLLSGLINVLFYILRFIYHVSRLNRLHLKFQSWYSSSADSRSQFLLCHKLQTKYSCKTWMRKPQLTQDEDPVRVFRSSLRKSVTNRTSLNGDVFTTNTVPQNKERLKLHLQLWQPWWIGGAVDLWSVLRQDTEPLTGGCRLVAVFGSGA